MITRIAVSNIDLINLKQIKIAKKLKRQKYNYKGWVVNKPWGYEYLTYENNKVAIWILFLSKNSRTSMHCHRQKKTSLLVLRGKVEVATLGSSFNCQEGEGIMIGSSVFHSTKAISGNGALVMEIEPVANKHDLLRFEDRYGREGQEYEGKEQMTRDYDQYEYRDLHKIASKSSLPVNLGSFEISLQTHDLRSTLHEKLRSERFQLICLLTGRLRDINGKTVALPGEIIDLDSTESVFFEKNPSKAISYLALKPTEDYANKKFDSKKDNK